MYELIITNIYRLYNLVYREWIFSSYLKCSHHSHVSDKNCSLLLMTDINFCTLANQQGHCSIEIHLQASYMNTRKNVIQQKHK